MQKGAHTQYDLQIHVVWITKYRKKILTYKIAYRLKELLMQGCSAKGITIIRGNIQPEHVHLLLSIPPTLSVAQIMQYLKGRSSKKLQEEFPKLRKQFWGQHMWATGYFCRSVGQVTRQTIEEYIENQKNGIEDIFVNDGNSMLQHRRSFSPHSKPCTLSAGWLIKRSIVTLEEIYDLFDISVPKNELPSYYKQVIDNCYNIELAMGKRFISSACFEIIEDEDKHILKKLKTPYSVVIQNL